MLERHDIEGFVLAGGASRRFGSDKARAVVNGSTLVEQNAAILSQRYATVRVVSAPGRSYEDLGLETIFDEVTESGPLAGIHAALTHSEHDVVAVLACDFAGVDGSWFELLESAWRSPAVAFRDDRWHPLFALYHRDILEELEQRLATGNLAVRALLDDVGHAVGPPPGFEGMRNANTLEEL